MGKDNSIGSLFGKARKWAQQEVKNAVSFDDASKRRADEEENDRRRREIESDVEQLRTDAVEDALTPDSLKGYQEMTAANTAARAAAAATAARQDRHERATSSTVELTGQVTGRAERLAVDSYTIADSNDLCVTVECVDPVPMAGGTLSGFCFKVPDFHGDDTYTLVDHADFDSLQYELTLTDENSEGWGFHPSFGPGSITVANGAADVSLVLGGAGDGTIQLEAHIVLT